MQAMDVIKPIGIVIEGARTLTVLQMIENGQRLLDRGEEIEALYQNIRASQKAQKVGVYVILAGLFDLGLLTCDLANDPSLDTKITRLAGTTISYFIGDCLVKSMHKEIDAALELNDAEEERRRAEHLRQQQALGARRKQYVKALAEEKFVKSLQKEFHRVV